MATTKLSQSTKEMACRFCHKPMTVNGYQRKDPGHFECAVAFCLDNSRQMASRSGPQWEKYLNGLAVFLRRMGWEVTPPRRTDVRGR